MSKEKNKSVLEEAVLEVKSILEAAEGSAKERIAKELPEKFEALLSEEIKKIKNKESVNESYKDDYKEPAYKGKKEDTDDNKESLYEMGEIDMREMSMEEVEEAYDEASDEDDFEITVDDITDEIDEMEYMQQEMEHMKEEDRMKKDMSDKSDPYDKLKHLYEMMSEMIKEMDDKKMHEQLQEKFDSHMKEMYGDSYKDMMGEEKYDELYEMYASHEKGDKPYNMKERYNMDETYDMKEMEHMYENVDMKQMAQKLADMYKWFQQNVAAPAAGGIKGGTTSMKETYDMDEMKYMKEKYHMDENVDLEKFGQKLADMYKWFQQNVAAPAAGGIKGGTTSMKEMKHKYMDETYDMDEMKYMHENVDMKEMAQKLADMYKWFQQNVAAPAAGGIKGGSTSVTEMEYDEEQGHERGEHDTGPDEYVDEALTKTHSANRHAGDAHLPNSKDKIAGKHRYSTQRPAQLPTDMGGTAGIYETVKRQNKKLKSLMEENKSLSKKLNETKTVKDKIEATNENYKGVLQKYRNQLQEMAILNTNIASVNDILIKENDLSFEEKQKIINKFKNIKSINEAENMHKSLLSEMTRKKETLDEGIENKLNNSIDPSSSKIVTEQVVEKTAFSNNSHLKKIKDIMNYDFKK